MSVHKNWDAESRLYDLECAIDTLDKVKDGLPEDRTTANALGLIHSSLCHTYAELKSWLLSDQ